MILGDARRFGTAIAARRRRVRSRQQRQRIKSTRRQHIDRRQLDQVAQWWQRRRRRRRWQVDQCVDGSTILATDGSIESAAGHVLVGIRCAGHVVYTPLHTTRVTKVVVDGLVRCGRARPTRGHDRRRRQSGWWHWWRRWRRRRQRSRRWQRRRRRRWWWWRVLESGEVLVEWVVMVVEADRAAARIRQTRPRQFVQVAWACMHWGWRPEAVSQPMSQTGLWFPCRRRMNMK